MYGNKRPGVHPGQAGLEFWRESESESTLAKTPANESTRVQLDSRKLSDVSHKLNTRESKDSCKLHPGESKWTLVALYEILPPDRSWFFRSLNSPVSQYERPRAVALASSACVDKTTKIITEFTRKDPFLRLKWVNKVLQKVSLWSKSICVTCKLLVSVYLDIKSLYPHLKVNWNVLLCKICIARRLVVDIFPWCNAHYVPFPSGTLVARRMGNGSIKCGPFWHCIS